MLYQHLNTGTNGDCAGKTDLCVTVKRTKTITHGRSLRFCLQTQPVICVLHPHLNNCPCRVKPQKTAVNNDFTAANILEMTVYKI